MAVKDDLRVSCCYWPPCLVTRQVKIKTTGVSDGPAHMNSLQNACTQAWKLLFFKANTVSLQSLSLYHTLKKDFRLHAFFKVVCTEIRPHIYFPLHTEIMAGSSCCHHYSGLVHLLLWWWWWWFLAYKQVRRLYFCSKETLCSSQQKAHQHISQLLFFNWLKWGYFCTLLVRQSYYISYHQWGRRQC